MNVVFKNIYWLVSIILFVTGFFFDDYSLDISRHDTYYVISYKFIFWILSLGWAAFGAVTSIVTGVFGKKSNPILTYIHIAATSIYLLLLFQLRILEPPRRYYSFSGFDAFKEADEISRKVIIVFVCIQFIFVFNIINSFVNSKKR